MAAPVKILFDTDPGIDDAMALLMLARDARAQLLGVSTVFGNAAIDTTTTNALALCERFGIDVPVARGAAQPHLRELKGYPVDIHGADGLGNVGLPAAMQRRLDARPAARFISETARAHPGELTLVAVGPMTNLADALAFDPELPRLVRRVVVMGGAFGTLGHGGNVTPVAEANVIADPHAADAVFTAPWKLTLVGLDVTHQVLMSTDYLNRLGDEGGEEGRFMRHITRLYEDFYHHRTGGGIYSHDASAVACALDASDFELRHGPVRVVTDGLAVGQTIQAPLGKRFPVTDWDGLPAQAACVGVDAPRVLARFADIFRR